MNRRGRRGNGGGADGVFMAEFFTLDAGVWPKSGTGILPVMIGGPRQDADATSEFSVLSAFSAVNLRGLF